MITVAFHTLGCKVNTYETEAMEGLLVEAGFNLVPWDDPADVYVINTCSVTNIADRKSRQMIHKAAGKAPEALIVAVGCYVEHDEKISEDEQIDLIIGNNRKKDIVKLIKDALYEKKQGIHDSHMAMSNLTQDVKYENMILKSSSEHTRAFVKIQDGCDQFCSYCVIPYVRGRIRSRSLDDIMAEVTGLAKAGYKEYIITGIHLSSYGMDFQDNTTAKTSGSWNYRYLYEVIEHISSIPGVLRIRLGSLEPRIITEEFLTKLSKVSSFCPHFHLSLQSGSDRILESMNRHYDTSEFRDRVKLIRSFFDHPAITTDIIVGYPGEDENDFADTVRFADEMKFYEMHIFPYSKRSGTKAAQMPGQLTAAVKAERVDQLEAVDKKNSKKYREYYVGKTIEVLAEHPVEWGGKKYMTGHTETYLRAAWEYDGDVKLIRNEIVSGVVTGFLTDDLVYLAKNTSNS